MPLEGSASRERRPENRAEVLSPKGGLLRASRIVRAQSGLVGDGVFPTTSRRGSRVTGRRRTEHADAESRKASAAIPRADFGPCDPSSSDQRWRPCAPDRYRSKELIVGAGPAAYERRALSQRAACLVEAQSTRAGEAAAGLSCQAWKASAAWRPMRTPWPRTQAHQCATRAGSGNAEGTRSVLDSPLAADLHRAAGRRRTPGRRAARHDPPSRNAAIEIPHVDFLQRVLEATRHH
jgi:hypothetical protein